MNMYQLVEFSMAIRNNVNNALGISHIVEDVEFDTNALAFVDKEQIDDCIDLLVIELQKMKSNNQ